MIRELEHVFGTLQGWNKWTDLCSCFRQEVHGSGMIGMSTQKLLLLLLGSPAPASHGKTRHDKTRTPRKEMLNVITTCSPKRWRRIEAKQSNGPIYPCNS